VGKEQYISLIAKQLSNELNSAELRELNHWLSGNSESQDALADFKDIWSSVSSYKAAATFDSSAAFAKFSQKYDISSDSKEVQTVDTQSTTTSSSLGASRILFIVLTAMALLLGGWFLSKNAAPSFTNEGMASLPIQLTKNASATLKPNSTLSFDKDKNQVNGLKGGAYFDLENLTKENALVLNLAHAQLEANNATLNIDNYKGEDLITSVEKGNVQIDIKDSKIDLKAGQSLIVNKNNGDHKITKAKVNDFLWEKGSIAFDNTPLDEAFALVEKFYGVEVIVSDNSKTSNAHITATILKDKSLNECLELIATITPMKITRSGKDGKVIHITDIQAK